MSAPKAAQLAAEAAYTEKLVELRLAEGGGFKVASQQRRAIAFALEAASPHIISEHLLKLAADVRARGDIGKDGGLESWDYLTWHAERILTE